MSDSEITDPTQNLHYLLEQSNHKQKTEQPIIGEKDRWRRTAEEEGRGKWILKGKWRAKEKESMGDEKGILIIIYVESRNFF